MFEATFFGEEGQEYEGTFTEKDLPQGLLEYYGSFHEMFEKCFERNQGYDIMSEGVSKAVEIPYDAFFGGSKVRKNVKLNLYPFDIDYKSEL